RRVLARGLAREGQWERLGRDLLRRGAIGRLQVRRLLVLTRRVWPERSLHRVLVTEGQIRLRPQDLALGEADERNRLVGGLGALDHLADGPLQWPGDLGRVHAAARLDADVLAVGVAGAALAADPDEPVARLLRHGGR